MSTLHVQNTCNPLLAGCTRLLQLCLKASPIGTAAPPDNRNIPSTFLTCIQGPDGHLFAAAATAAAAARLQ
jgi:hypothetical protein